MDFFDHQDRSRKKTKHLVLLFGLAVSAIILSVYAASRILAYQANQRLMSNADFQAYTFSFWDSDLFLGISIGVLLLIAIGSIYKTATLRKGGSAVARMLGATCVQPSTKDPNERKLRNVVEEMAIASGIPVPEIYIMEEEDSINAFAAGFTPSDAVVGVTRGALTKLNRDELQGVIAHEFSHIFHGDMRLNIRLMGLLHGILLIGLVGYGVMRGSRGGGRKGGGIVIFGLALLAIGYIGVFFGKLIQAAVSRQREFLADASAVQFTRNPNGIRDALTKIGQDARGANISNRHATEVGHMTFGSPSKSFINLLATHPPLEKRIQAIDPDFKGAAQGLGTTKKDEGLSTVSLLNSVGAPTPAHLESASTFMAGIPASLHAALTESLGAQAVIYSMILLASENREKELSLLAKRDSKVHEKVLELQTEMAEQGNRNRLEWIDISLPALRTMTPEEFATFKKTLLELIHADQKVDLFELTLVRILERHLAVHWGKPNRKEITFRSLQPLREEIRDLLSHLSHSGSNNDEAKASISFDLGWKELGLKPHALLPRSECDVETFAVASDRCSKATPLVKRKILGACVKTVSADEKITWEEAELIRAIGDTLNVPIPPLLSS